MSEDQGTEAIGKVLDWYHEFLAINGYTIVPVEPTPEMLDNMADQAEAKWVWSLMLKRSQAVPLHSETNQ